MACSTIATRFFSKNGRISGGSSAIARSRMNLCASKPHALAGRASPAAISTTSSRITDARRRTLYNLIRSPLYLHQPPKRFEIPQVPRIGVAAATALRRIELRRLEHHRQRLETRIGEDA